MLCEPNYADEGGTMVVCEDCDDAGESFDLGKYGEGRALAIAAWNKRAPSERQAIVIWLLSMKLDYTNWPQHLAKRIARGEHLEGGNG